MKYQGAADLRQSQSSGDILGDRQHHLLGGRIRPTLAGHGLDLVDGHQAGDLLRMIVIIGD